MTDFTRDDEEARERRVSLYIRRLAEIIAEKALEGDEVHARVMERVAPFAKQNGIQDIFDDYRAKRRMKMQ